MSQSRADAQRIINNIMNYHNDENCCKVWTDFNPDFTISVQKYIKKYQDATESQILGLIHVYEKWIFKIQDFNFNNPINKIVYKNNNKNLTYHKVVKCSKKNIFKTPIPTSKQGTIKAFFAKA
jgi:hypothetical protein